MKLDAKKILASKPRQLRSSVSYAAAGELAAEADDSQAWIRNVSMVSHGEALGHDVWLDSDFLSQVYQAALASGKGVKSRYTHPSMSADGLGNYVGRVQNPKLAGDQVIGDLKLSDASRMSPGKGDLAAYVMQLANEDPEAFGMSIVFESDVQAEIAHFEANGGVVIDDPEMGLLWDSSNFKSPDPLNTKNLRHARLADLHTVDFVDEPAANPSGLFHRQENLLAEANTLAAYALGIADTKPQLVQLDSLNADRVRGFVTRFLSAHKLEVRPMADATTVVEEITEVAPVVEQTTEEVAEQVEPVVEVTEEVAATETVAASRGEAAAFLSAFGNDGAVWYAQNLTMEQARDRQLSELKLSLAAITAERDKYKTAAQLLAGEKNPVTFEASDKPKKAGFASTIRIHGQS